MPDASLEKRLRVAIAATRMAGRKTLQWFQTDDLTINRKEDNSPVTAADLAAEDRVWRLCARVLQGREPQHAALRGLLLPPGRDGHRRHELLSVGHSWWCSVFNQLFPG